MTLQALVDSFTKHGNCEHKGAVVTVPDATAATLFVSLGNQGLTIEQVARVETADDGLAVTTRRGDRYIVMAQDVRAVRFSDERARRTGVI